MNKGLDVALKLRGKIYLLYNKQNKYSFASLIGALESKSVLSNYNLEVVVNEGKLACSIDHVKNSHENPYHFMLFSLNSLHFQAIKEELEEFKNILLKERLDEKVYFLAGGPHASARPEDLVNAGFDYVFTGEGEMAIVEFFKEFFASPDDREEKQETSFIPSSTPNCFFKSNQTRMYSTEKAPWINLDEYPPFASTTRLFRPIEISRGCPHGCHYCQTPALFGYKMRHRSVENVVSWMKKAVQLKYDKAWFTTPNAFAFGSKGSTPNAQTIEKLLKSLKNIQGLDQIFFGTFPAEVRPDYVTDEVLDAVIPYISNNRFIVGAQSASPRMLKAIHRGHDVQDVWDAIDIITGKGFSIDLDMIFGLPNEDEKDRESNIEFITEVLKNSKVRIHGHVFMPLPGTAFEKEKPGTIEKELAKVVGHYASIGRIYGSHFQQIKTARQYSEQIEIE